MNKHPLSDFQDLIENEYRISAIRNTFLTEAIKLSDNDQAEIPEEEAECFVMIDPDSYPPVQELVGIDDYIRLQLKVHQVIKEIDLSILNILDKKEQDFYISNINSCVAGLQELLSKREDLSKYPAIKESLLKIRDSISVKYELTTVDDFSKELKKPVQKIQWLGKTNVLSTLIYDLWQGQDKGKGKPSIPSQLKADKKDLIRLLTDNFLDSQGNPLTEATISDYLNSSKPEKRAKTGRRIEL